MLGNCVLMSDSSSGCGYLNEPKMNGSNRICDISIIFHAIATYRATIELLRLVPLVYSRTSGIGVPHTVQPAVTKCSIAQWDCTIAEWKRGINITIVRLDSTGMYNSCDHTQFFLPLHWNIP